MLVFYIFFNIYMNYHNFFLVEFLLEIDLNIWTRRIDSQYLKWAKEKKTGTAKKHVLQLRLL